MRKLNVLIAGSTGYIGVQLVKLLNKHQNINIKYLFLTIGIAMSLVGLVLFLNMFGPNWNPETKNVSLRK